MRNIGWRKGIVLFYVVLLCVVSSVPCFSQVGDPGGGTDPDVPISGIEWLLVGGGILGMRKIFRRLKKG